MKYRKCVIRNKQIDKELVNKKLICLNVGNYCIKNVSLFTLDSLALYYE